MKKFFAVAAALLALTSCTPSASRWAAFENAFTERYFELEPTFASYQGRHEFDGRLPDWTEEGIAAQIAFLRSSIEDAEAFSGLSPELTYQRDYLVAVARADLFWLEAADQPHRNPAFYMNRLSPSVYVTRPYAAPDVRLRAYHPLPASDPHGGTANPSQFAHAVAGVVHQLRTRRLRRSRRILPRRWQSRVRIG